MNRAKRRIPTVYDEWGKNARTQRQMNPSKCEPFRTQSGVERLSMTELPCPRDGVQRTMVVYAVFGIQRAPVLESYLRLQQRSELVAIENGPILAILHQLARDHLHRHADGHVIPVDIGQLGRHQGPLLQAN